MRRYIIGFYILACSFNLFSQDNQTRMLSFVHEFSDSRKMIVELEYSPTGVLVRESKQLVDMSDEVIIPESFCFNEVSFYDPESSSMAYYFQFPNTWFENGSVQRQLICQDSIITYNHFDSNGKLIGQEKFIRSNDRRKIFYPTGPWWKGEVTGIDPHSIDLNQDYFEY